MSLSYLVKPGVKIILADEAADQEQISGGFVANVAAELALNFDAWFHLYEPSLYARD